MNFLGILMRNLAQGPSTEAFPFGEATTPKGLRGRVHFDAAACMGCRLCEQVCAPGAIRFEKKKEGLGFLLWHNSCCFCGLCQHYCPVDAITLSEDWHLAHPESEKFAMVEEGLLPNVACAGCGKETLSIGVNVATLAFQPTAEEMAQLHALCPACRRKAAAAMQAARKDAGTGGQP
ncbi:4Fe-4S dicluster domain-containing protein [Azospirillum sp.]|uniref:4Fe-4S dicluster domain-containing protein n=1 Tax=Azospirillum sp. TaxID=34012 RepID=UPI002D5AFE3E|nr:4Fe-4S binding protein [Azospirillum sp.]HYD65452.1 4Fe-4S binding protein [Azospirillum sp.]